MKKSLEYSIITHSFYSYIVLKQWSDNKMLNTYRELYLDKHKYFGDAQVPHGLKNNHNKRARGGAQQSS
jgi:hypothetical protein